MAWVGEGILRQADDAHGGQGLITPPQSELQADMLRDEGTATPPLSSEPLHASPAAFQLGRLPFPVLLMNLPLSLSTQIPNNAWMVDISPNERTSAWIGLFRSFKVSTGT
jgi:hypothetical protein